MSKICKKRVHGNEKINLPCAFKKCPGSLNFTLLSAIKGATDFATLHLQVKHDDTILSAREHPLDIQ